MDAFKPLGWQLQSHEAYATHEPDSQEQEMRHTRSCHVTSSLTLGHFHAYIIESPLTSLVFFSNTLVSPRSSHLLLHFLLSVSLCLSLSHSLTIINTITKKCHVSWCWWTCYFVCLLVCLFAHKSSLEAICFIIFAIRLCHRSHPLCVNAMTIKMLYLYLYRYCMIYLS